MIAIVERKARLSLTWPTLTEGSHSLRQRQFEQIGGHIRLLQGNLATRFLVSYRRVGSGGVAAQLQHRKAGVARHRVPVQFILEMSLLARLVSQLAANQIVLRQLDWLDDLLQLFVKVDHLAG